MGSQKKLDYRQLRRECNPQELEFQTTAELEANEGIIGQERAKAAMEFGMNIEGKGYNIFLSGINGEWKKEYAYTVLTEAAEKKPVPSDWCYVHNFAMPSQPITIELPAGMAVEFQKEMEQLAKQIKVQLPIMVEDLTFQALLRKVDKEYNTLETRLWEELVSLGKEKNLSVRMDKGIIKIVPTMDGKLLNQEQYDNLEPEIRERISQDQNMLLEACNDYAAKVNSYKRIHEEKTEEAKKTTAAAIIETYLGELRGKYSGFSKVNAYFDALAADMLENLEELVFGEKEVESGFPQLFDEKDEILDKYKVNVVVDNRNLKGAPVVVSNNPNYMNLTGTVEHKYEFGFKTTDYSYIRAGQLQKANGGYLIVDALEVLTNQGAWEALKQTLKTENIRIAHIFEQMGVDSVSDLKPEGIPVKDLKIVMLGDTELYFLLYEYDEDFKNLFKINVDFESYIPYSNQNVKELCGFISRCSRQKGIHFDAGAAAGVIDYCCKLTESQNKLTADMDAVKNIIEEAVTWASCDKKTVVERKHVERAVKEKERRSERFYRSYLKWLDEGIIMVDTAGCAVGQINALAVTRIADVNFGIPSRITAATFIGKDGIINVERRSLMSGPIHSKGVDIVSGYLGQKYGQNKVMALTASICFEQNYEGVDGDSASSTELYAIISSLSGVPINQGIAVTGSVNQHGVVQAIGGVNQKIAGYFELCRSRGFDGSHGVLIPYSNIKDLCLPDEIVEAVKDGLFSIYSVSNIEEGIEILTGRTLKEIDGIVNKKLTRFAKIAAGKARGEEGVFAGIGKRIRKIAKWI